MNGSDLINLGKRRRLAARPHLPKRRFGRVAAICALIVISALALVGPTGIRAWSDAERLRDQREAELAQLQKERARVANRVELLDPAEADPDLVGELLRRDLNVAHPDEVVVPRQ